MDINDLLLKQGFDLEKVLVFRHRPSEPTLRKVLPWFAGEQPEIYNAYQQTQGKTLECTMQKLEGSGYIVSCIGHEPRKALFVGLYAIVSSIPVNLEDYWELPYYSELKKYGMKRSPEKDDRTTQLVFDLKLLDFYQQWKGKMIIEWPPPERSWWRRAHRNIMLISSVLEESVFDEAMPEWDRLDFTWEELSVLPTSWKEKLRQWRGIYYIHDTSDGKGYVGSAYGKDNILGRWGNYTFSGHGGNKYLLKRKPQNFRFCILQRVSPDMEQDKIISLESSWKLRLHTYYPEGLNDN